MPSSFSIAFGNVNLIAQFNKMRQVGAQTTYFDRSNLKKIDGKRVKALAENFLRSK
jgi:hypothetical protein